MLNIANYENVKNTLNDKNIALADRKQQVLNIKEENEDDTINSLVCIYQNNDVSKFVKEWIMETLIDQFMGLICKVAQKFISINITFDDLKNAGRLGVFEAVSSYDINKNTKFSTHVYNYINSEERKIVGSEFSNTDKPYYYSLSIRVVNAIREIEASGQKNWTEQDISNYINSHSPNSRPITAVQVNHALQVINHSNSSYVSYESMFVENKKDKPSEYDVENLIENQQTKQDITNALNNLTDIEKIVVMAKEGYPNSKKRNNHQVSKLLNESKYAKDDFTYTPFYVSKIYAQALQKLRDILRPMGYDENETKHHNLVDCGIVTLFDIDALIKEQDEILEEVPLDLIG